MFGSMAPSVGTASDWEKLSYILFLDNPQGDLKNDIFLISMNLYNVHVLYVCTAADNQCPGRSVDGH